jgi:hypothetical protein
MASLFLHNLVEAVKSCRTRAWFAAALSAGVASLVRFNMFAFELSATWMGLTGGVLSISSGLAGSICAANACCAHGFGHLNLFQGPADRHPRRCRSHLEVSNRSLQLLCKLTGPGPAMTGLLWRSCLWHRVAR